MRIAFVGVKRKYRELDPTYIDLFNRYHLELPFYYARDGENEVTITTVDYEKSDMFFVDDWRIVNPVLNCQLESNFQSSEERFDVVIHWRKWFPELYKPDAINLINCQDHSFSEEWKRDVKQAFEEGKLKGILCFPTWHKRNLQRETGLPSENLFEGVTLGVDTDIYDPNDDKNPYEMLWSSDPGRGLDSAMGLAIRLFQQDKRFKLHICYPDYVRKPSHVSHPALVWHGCMKNGPELWDLFNSCGVLPYTSTFMEPSSRAHRQMQAAGGLVLYPPCMGSPSELIMCDVDGIVSPPMTWPNKIVELVESGLWKTIGKSAREMAVSENWAVQATRFNNLIKRIGETR